MSTTKVWEEIKVVFDYFCHFAYFFVLSIPTYSFESWSKHNTPKYYGLIFCMISWPCKIMFQLNNYCKYLISFFKSSWVFIIFFIVLLSFMGWLILFKKTYAYWFHMLTNGTPLNKLRWWHQKVTKHFDHVW